MYPYVSTFSTYHLIVLLLHSPQLIDFSLSPPTFFIYYLFLPFSIKLPVLAAAPDIITPANHLLHLYTHFLRNHYTSNWHSINFIKNWKAYLIVNYLLYYLLSLRVDIHLIFLNMILLFLFLFKKPHTLFL